MRRRCACTPRVPGTLLRLGRCMSMIVTGRFARGIAKGAAGLLFPVVIACCSFGAVSSPPTDPTVVDLEGARQIADVIVRAACSQFRVLLVVEPHAEITSCPLEGVAIPQSVLSPKEVAAFSGSAATSQDLAAVPWREACANRPECREVTPEELGSLTTDGDGNLENDWDRVDARYGYRFAMEPGRIRVDGDLAVGCAYIARGWPTGQNWVYVLRRKAGRWALVEAVRDDSIVY